MRSTSSGKALLLALALLAPAARAQFLQGGHLLPAQLGLIINDAEPNSVEIGEYYRQQRGIPPENVVHVQILDKPRKLDADSFAKLKAQIDARLGAGVQAVLMVWTAPYAVECNSITAAYTMGFDASVCRPACPQTRPSPYFNATTARPYSGMAMRLSMLLPTDSVAQSKALIDRGVQAVAVPGANAFYVTTGDRARNSRAPYFPPPGEVKGRKVNIKRVSADFISGEEAILVYQTGAAKVDKLDTLRFLPGALADHLTSYGGDLYGTGQMSSLRWLEAGATATYGTVSEPCNYWQKFPQPTVLLRHYLGGATAIEAYWRSVAWPMQGVFVGEPLAAPYAASMRR
jgi:uncharacterized protein (TIGR03790 family)